MKTLVLANHKGGVGKSALATLLAQRAHAQGHRVLAIDLDHQGNLSSAVALSKRARTSDAAADQLFSGGRVNLPSARFVLVPAGDGLLGLERQPQQHTPFARSLRDFLRAVDAHFDLCVIDTNPNPDIRLIAALATGDFVLSPIQLNQEAIDGVRALLHHPRVGLHKIRAVLNPKLTLIGLLPTLVEPTPFQRANFIELVQKYASLMIRLSQTAGDFARLPKRSAIAEAQADGLLLWEMKKTAARDAWAEIEPSLRRILEIVVGQPAIPSTDSTTTATTSTAEAGRAL
jgi:chromosome partitioning protein